MVLQLKRQLCGAQSPLLTIPGASLCPPGGLLRVLCFNRFRAGGPALAGPCLSHFTRACCVVRTLSAEPFWLSLCFDLCAYGQC